MTIIGRNHIGRDYIGHSYTGVNLFMGNLHGQCFFTEAHGAALNGTPAECPFVNCNSGVGCL